MPLEPKDVTAAGLVQFPTVVGGDVPVVNLDGVGADQLVLDGPTLANIFLGKITKWDDPAIAKLNPSVKLPSQAIVVVHRSDGSGTTFIFTNYLSKVSPDWKSNVGASTAVEWPVGIGAKGNEGVSNNVTQAKGAIGYVEYAYALQNKMASVDMINADGKRVAAERRGVPGGRGKRRLGQVGPLLRHSDQSAGRDHLADRRRDLHPDVSAPRRHGGRGRSPQVLQLGLHQRRQAGRGARLRAAAGHGRRSDPEDLGRQHHDVATASRCSSPSSHWARRKVGAFSNAPTLTPGAALPPRCRSSVGGAGDD